MKIANYKRCLPQALAALLLIGGGATQALAQTSTVNVTGNITGECRITGGDNLSFDLGDVLASSLNAVGATSPTSPEQYITLACTGNPPLKMTMSGTQHPGTTATSVLALSNTGTGAATGVGVQLLWGLNMTPTNLLTRNTPVTVYAAAGATPRVRISARYYATSATPNAGAANATATLTFTVN